MNAWIKSIISLLLLAIMIAFAHQRSEAPLPHTDAGLDFAALSRHVEQMSGTPHPIGSAANRVVRDYIVAQFESLGLTTEIQKTTVVFRDPGSSTNSPLVANVENIIARLPGTLVAGDQVHSDLVLMAHYDSRENAPGAGDDISGTASLLEVARILSKAPAPLHDIVFLITDGEEVGLMGAQGFFRQHPAAKRAGLVLNFEARGSKGASSLFETSANNAWLIEHIKKAIPDFVGDSLTYEVYRRMPNDTDLSISKGEGIAGLNFAFAKGLIDYHAMTDSSENLDKNSLAQQAYYALSAARYFANLEQWQTAQSDRTYFDSGFGQVLSYSQVSASVAGYLVLLLGIGILVLALRRRMTRWRSLGTGSLAILTIFLFSYAIFQTAMGFLNFNRSQFYPDNPGLAHLVSLGEWPLLAYFIVTLGGLLWFNHVLKRGLRTWEIFVPALLLGLAVLVTGAWLLTVLLLLVAVPCLIVLQRSKAKVDIWSASLMLWWVLALLVVFSAPNASYVFIWPLASILFGIAVQMKMQFPADGGSRFTLVLLSALIPLLLLSLLLLTMYVLSGSSAPQVVMVFCTLCLLLIWPLVKQIDAESGGKAALVLLGIGLVMMTIFMTGRDFDARYPRGEELFFAVDVEQGNSFWVSRDVRSGSWLGDFFGESPDGFEFSKVIPGFDAVADSIPATKPALIPATLEVKSKSSINDQHEITWHLKSPSGSEYINVLLPTDAGIRSLTANGQEIDMPENFPDSGWWRLRWYGLQEEGGELVLKTAAGTPLSVKVVEVSYGLPQGAPARPDNSMPRQYSWSDSTVIFHTLVFD